ncbi:MFS transporter [Mycobacterium sp. IS-1742]|uniref:MFS transporter n=1 Tax=Mycobacterium sp. IS-1742 TaxID=1772285 RepID=UPI0007404039|nr:MFS transporter [Mycobacterium sp. IS-1742]KUI27869.1 MFS transporter [Mycobacterium sp. IS-1742]
MKRSFSFVGGREALVIAFGTSFIAAAYGLVRLAYGLFLPDIQADLGLSAAVAGYISSASSLFYCVAAAVGFALGNRLPRPLIVTAAATACVGVWGMSAAHDILAFGVFAVLSSACAGIASPAMVSIVARNIEPRRVDGAQAMVNGGTGPGLVVAGVLALLLLPQWRLTWVVIGAVTAACAAALLAVDRPARSSTPDRPRRPSTGWLRRHATAIAAAVLMGAASSAVWTYGRSLLVETGAVSQRGTIAAWIVLGLGSAAVIVTATPLAKLTPVTAWTSTCTVMTGAVLLLAAVPDVTPAALLGCFAFGWGFTAATSSLILWTTAIDPANAAAGTALLFVALMFGQAVGATVLGAVITGTGFAPAFAVAAALSAVSIAVAEYGRRRNAAESSEPAVTVA